MFSTCLTRGRRALALCPLLSLALITAACGGGTTTSEAPPPVAHPHRHTSSSSTTTTTDTTTSTTTTDSSTTADLPGDGKPTVTIAEKNYTEQFVLGQLYLQALEAQGYTVNINQNIGPTDVTLQALKSGALAMYPEYLYVLNSSIAHAQHGHASAQDAYDAAQQGLSGRGLVLLDMTPFSDTFGLAVTDAYGAAHRLHALGDLRRGGRAPEIGGG